MFDGLEWELYIGHVTRLAVPYELDFSLVLEEIPAVFLRKRLTSFEVGDDITDLVWREFLGHKKALTKVNARIHRHSDGAGFLPLVEMTEQKDLAETTRKIENKKSGSTSTM